MATRRTFLHQAAALTITAPNPEAERAAQSPWSLLQRATLIAFGIAGQVTMRVGEEEQRQLEEENARLNANLPWNQRVLAMPRRFTMAYPVRLTRVLWSRTNDPPPSQFTLQVDFDHNRPPLQRSPKPDTEQLYAILRVNGPALLADLALTQRIVAFCEALTAPPRQRKSRLQHLTRSSDKILAEDARRVLRDKAMLLR